MLQFTEKGLYCEAGRFYIDPSRAVETAVLTHGHSDHARKGAQYYYCAKGGVGILRARLGVGIQVKDFRYGERFRLGDVWVSFHPAGHILGSAQVRLERAVPLGPPEVWVVSGDYKREPDPTCEAYEIVRCDVFVTEATFGTPAYQWPASRDLGKEIVKWWEHNRSEGRNSILFAYALGKAQRILGELRSHTQRPVLTHESVTKITQCYVNESVELTPFHCLSTVSGMPTGELLIIPPTSFDDSIAARFAPSATAFASGWMGTAGGWNRDRYDTGFVMSDHADWNALLQTIRETGASRVYVQHRGTGALVRHLRSIGLEAYPDSALKGGEAPAQLSLNLSGPA